ncbi:MAG: ABC transporter substrate-binding protein [Deltaproteobacteria bacterium]|uniref:ABC transporter substrate-binding protein n=1 Tax=Candidatus Zymogenus saltonus TaxID=2844893 RepID=A0A9D8KH79_9DELT|nr:ABC transporter substrate-binding protein [Candidatus Zymogenus saltonus]
MKAFRLFAVFVLIFGLFCVIGCEPKPAEEVPGVTDTEILIGTTGPLTGPANAWGAVQRAMETYFKAINAEGGINGRNLKIVILDDGYMPPNALTNVKKLVEEEKVFAIVGVLGAANVEAVKDYIDKSDVPWIGVIGGNRSISEPPLDNVFVGYPQYYLGAQALVNYAAKDLGVKTIGVFYQNDEFGGDGLAGAEKAATENGIEVVERVAYEVSDTDFSAHALKMKQANPDAVVIYGTARHSALFVGTCAQLGFLPQWLGTSAISDPVMIKLLGKAWDGAIVANFAPNPQGDSEGALWYRKALEEYAESDVDKAIGTFTIAGFYFAEYLVEGLKKVKGPLTRESLIKSMNSFKNVSGMFIHDVTYSKKDHRGQTSFYLMKANAETGELEDITGWFYPAE